jgi:hypothetical protein
VGDKALYGDQMTNPSALAPFPNAIVWNWATVVILAVGNLGALDIQSLCMSSVSARTARVGCILSGIITIVVGITFSYLGGISRKGFTL